MCSLARSVPCTARCITFDADLTWEDLDALKDEIYAHVRRLVLRSAHQNPDNEKMNLPYRRR